MPIEPHTYWEPRYVSKHVWDGICLRRGGATPADPKTWAVPQHRLILVRSQWRADPRIMSQRRLPTSRSMGPARMTAEDAFLKLWTIFRVRTRTMCLGRQRGASHGVFGKSSLLIQPLPASAGHRHRVCDDLCFDGAWS